MVNNNTDKQYFELINHILKNGVKKLDRTGTGTISVFDYTMRFNMDEGFPLLTSKKMFTKGIIHELIWFLSGDTNIKYLLDNGVGIWTGDAYKRYRSVPKDNMCDGDLEFLSASHAYEDYYSEEDFVEMIKSDDDFAKKWGELGPVYGKQWRNWNGIDQISNLINDLKNNPDSRRLMVSAWNPSELENQVLPPCHYVFQCYTQEMELNERVRRWCKSLDKDILYGDDMTHEKLDNVGFPKRKLSLKFNMRSIDSGLGLPFNIASYALLLHLLSREVNMIPCDLIFSGGDCHIYLNHVIEIEKQLNNETFKLPNIELYNKSIYDLKFDDIKILNYKSSASVKMALSN